MTTVELIEQVAHRIGEAEFSKHGAPYVLSTMNRIYHWLNIEKRLLERSKTYAPEDFDSANSASLPWDMSAILSVSPIMTYYPKDAFFKITSFSRPAWTIFSGRIYLSAKPQNDVTIYYYSMGKNLATEINDQEKETDAPEWPEKAHQILFYGTATEISQTYPYFKMDIAKYAELTEDLSYFGKIVQEGQPGTDMPDELLGYSNAGDYRPY